MAQPRKEDLVTALDIGSSKVSALIAERNEDGEPLTVLGTGQRESRGVRRGYIADMDATERAVREAVEQAEKIAGLTVEDVWVSFSAGGLVSKLASVETNLGGHRIEQVRYRRFAGAWPQLDRSRRSDGAARAADAVHA